jgi:hypothetical protein
LIGTLKEQSGVASPGERERENLLQLAIRCRLPDSEDGGAMQPQIGFRRQQCRGKNLAKIRRMQDAAEEHS